MIKNKKIIGILPDYKYLKLTHTRRCPESKLVAYVKQEYIDAIENFSQQDVMTVMINKNFNNIKEYIEMIDGLLIVGGQSIPSDIYNGRYYKTIKTMPERFVFEIKFIQEFLKTKKNILGVCAGMQSINVALGGKMIQSIKNHSVKIGTKINDNKHMINIIQNTKLHSILKKNQCIVNTAHYQAIDKKYLPKKLIISSFAEDGIPESIEHKEHPFCIGVQWHPECKEWSEENANLFKAFLKI